MDLSATTIFIIFLAVIGVSIFAGYWLARRLRMRDYGWKLALIFASIFGALTITTLLWDQIKLGIDLAGGVRLIYEIQSLEEAAGEELDQDQDLFEAADGGDPAVDPQSLVDNLKRRINPSGLEDIIIRPYGKRQVEIIVPEADPEEINRLKTLVTKAGALEFRIVVDPNDPKASMQVAAEEALDPQNFGKPFISDEDGTEIARWFQVGKTKKFNSADPTDFTEDYVNVLDALIRDDRTKKIIQWTSQTTPSVSEQFIRLPTEWRNEIARGEKGFDDVLEGGLDPPIEAIEVLMLTEVPELQVTGEDLASASVSSDSRGFPAVSFVIKDLSVDKFGALTSEYSPDPTTSRKRQLGIILDNTLLSAPTLNERITKHGQITGGFSEQEVQDLVSILRAGRLPAMLNPTPLRDDHISAILGQVTIRQGKWAIGIGMAIVLVFMLFYYRVFAGGIACLAVVSNLVLILAVMILIKAKFTLPGLAGLVLMVGMAVDANVLIFERIREELRRGAGLRMAIRNGFGRATTTIVDANLTTLITAIVLYAIGTEEIRGFAVTLILGILMSMYTAIFCARVAFDVAERQTWLKQLKMTQLLGETKIDFIGKRRFAGVASAVVILVGLFAVGVRGQNIFDIDLLGGSSVDVAFTEEAAATMSERKIRQQLEGDEERKGLKDTYNDVLEEAVKAEEITDADLERLRQKQVYMTITELPDAEDELGVPRPPNSVWKIDTSLPNVEFFKRSLHKIFQDDLLTHEVSITQPRPVDRVVTPEEIPKKTESPDAATSHDSDGADSEAADEPSENANVVEEANEDLSEEKSPSEDDGARTDLPSDPLMASVGDIALLPLLLGQVEGDAGESEEPVSEQPDDEEPADAADQPRLTQVDRSASVLTFDQLMEKESVMARIHQAMDALDETSPPDFNAFPVDEEGNLLEEDVERSMHWLVQFSAPPAKAQEILAQVEKTYDASAKFYSFGGIEGQIAGQAQQQALAAILISLLGIVAYIWIRFQRVMYGLAAVAALVHDVLITLGAIGASALLAPALGFLLIEEFRISLPMVAAFLTIIGYSLNDTIVVFDRIREVRGKSPDLTSEMINTSINQTLSRTLLTSLTTLLVVVILYAIGGPGIHGFAFALVVGVIVGTYSSVFVASPLLLWMTSPKTEQMKKTAEPAKVG